MNTQDAGHEATPSPSDATERRGFVKLMAGFVSLLVGLIPAGIGLGFFLDPILRKKQGDGSAADPLEPDGAVKDAEGFIRLDVTIDTLPQDGTPIAVKVKDDKIDAWNRFRDIDVGTIWLRRMPDDTVLAMSSICPHLGCAVDYRPADNDFFCPCHTSSFDLTGQKTNNIPPRGMDHLEARMKPETGNQIWLKYETFRTGTPEKERIA